MTYERPQLRQCEGIRKDGKQCRIEIFASFCGKHDLERVKREKARLYENQPIYTEAEMEYRHSLIRDLVHEIETCGMPERHNMKLCKRAISFTKIKGGAR